VHTSTIARFRQAYNDIARRLLIPGWNDPNVDTLQLVYEHLTDRTNCQWLLILDNADDREMFFPSSNTQGQRGDIARYIPHNPRGSVIITTRDGRVGRKLANGEEPIPVSQMKIQEAKDMMLSRVLESCCESDLERLLYNLDCLPLAITQAAAFMTETHIKLSKYVDLLDEDDSSLLSKEFDDGRRDSETANSVIQTWKLSFDQIRKQNPRAADLLSLMAVLDRQGLQLFLLRQQEEHEAEFLTALGVLQSFSLVQSEKGGELFEMHRLVQLATQSWLQLQGVLSKWREQALSLLSESFPLPVYQNWEICEGLSPHAQAILRCAFELESCVLQRAKLLNALGRYEQSQGRYGVAYENISKALKERENLLGMDHLDTLTSLSNLATVLELQGKYAAAEEMERRALEGRETVLGREHPDTLVSLSNLALVLLDRGKYSAAEEMNRRAVEGNEKVLGDDHVETLIAISNLAGVLEKLGKYDAAEEMSRCVLERRERVLGKEHPDTLTSIANLAWVLDKQHKSGEAEEMHRRVLDSREKALGKEHPVTIVSVSNLAALLQKQGKYNVSEEMLRGAIKIREKALGKEHPHTLNSLHDLALVLQYQGKYEEAKEITLRVIEVKEKVIGEEHPDTLMSVYCLAYLYHGQREYETALELYQKASMGFRKVLGLAHPITSACDFYYSAIRREIEHNARIGTRPQSSPFQFPKRRRN